MAAKLVADAWCAAFVQPKTGTHASGSGHHPCHLARPVREPTIRARTAVIKQIRTLARQYRFFHWHLEFPGIFTVGDGNEDPTTGWTGGFSCVIGNPPWERVKIQDKEFFGNLGRTDIENAATAAIRKKMIEELADTDPHLYKAYRERPATVRSHSASAAQERPLSR